jgi:hypothetical protein
MPGCRAPCQRDTRVVQLTTVVPSRVPPEWSAQGCTLRCTSPSVRALTCLQALLQQRRRWLCRRLAPLQRPLPPLSSGFRTCPRAPRTSTACLPVRLGRRGPARSPGRVCGCAGTWGREGGCALVADRCGPPPAPPPHPPPPPPMAPITPNPRLHGAACEHNPTLTALRAAAIDALGPLADPSQTGPYRPHHSFL